MTYSRAIICRPTVCFLNDNYKTKIRNLESFHATRFRICHYDMVRSNGLIRPFRRSLNGLAEMRYDCAPKLGSDKHGVNYSDFRFA